MHNGPDKGLLKLISQKLEKGISIGEVKGMLLRMGISKATIEHAFLHISSHDKRAHQHVVASNDFLPPLSKKTAEEANRTARYLENVIDSELKHSGLFAGRLRQKEFIIGLLYFFGLAYIFFTAGIYFIQSLAPILWRQIGNVISNDFNGVWLSFIPFIFAPITIVVISLLARRLQHFELPGYIAWFYLLFFVSPLNGLTGYALLSLQISLVILLVVMMLKKGHFAKNKHGAVPGDMGSIFKKIFGYELV